MKNVITICLMFVMFCFVGQVFGDIIVPFPSDGGGSGGGGGGTLPTEPTISGRINQSMNFEGFNANLYAENSSAWLHEWTDEDGQTYSHVHEKESTGHLHFDITQDTMNQYYLPKDIELNVTRWDDNGSFNIRTSFTMLFVDESEVQDWIAPPSGSMGWDLFGINYNAGSWIRHEEEYNYDDLLIITDNIVGVADYWFQDSEVKYANVYVNETSYWDNGIEQFGMNLNAYFEVKYLGGINELKIFNSMIPFQIPEPTTLSVLALGTIFLRRVLRKKK